MFMSVDLPAPFSPSRAWTSPLATERSTPSQATTPGNRLVMSRSSTFIRAWRSRGRRCLDLAVDDLLAQLLDLVLQLLGHLAVELVERRDAHAVVLERALPGAALELVVGGVHGHVLHGDVHVLHHRREEHVAALLDRHAAVGV